MEQESLDLFEPSQGESGMEVSEEMVVENEKSNTEEELQNEGGEGNSLQKCFAKSSRSLSICITLETSRRDSNFFKQSIRTRNIYESRIYFT